MDIFGGIPGLPEARQAKMLFSVNLAGNIEKLFEKLDSYKEMPSVDEILRVHEELGLKIVGPQLQL